MTAALMGKGDKMILSQKEAEELVQKAKELQKVFDKEEIFYGCTVQVLTNTKTGEVSVGWYRPNGEWELLQ